MLGAILVSPDLFEQASEQLTTSDFHLTPNRLVFHAMSKLKPAEIDAITIRGVLEKAGKLDEVGGVSYLSSLMDGAFRMSNIDSYIRVIRERALRRRIIHVGNDLVHRGLATEDAESDLLDHAEKVLQGLAERNQPESFQKFGDVLPDTYAHLERISKQGELLSGIPTGFLQLDQMLSGLQPGELILLAARPGCGKTSLAMNVAQYAAKCDCSVAIFSLEMSARALVLRMLCGEARVDSHRVRTGRISRDNWSDLTAAMSVLSEVPIYIDDSSSLTVAEMSARARRAKAEWGIDLLIVDYLQLMRGQERSREQQIAGISRSLKGLAKELDIPVLALSQLNRAPEQRKGDHKPKLSDLRESGSLEQDADVVLFIYRPDQYKDDDQEEESNVATIKIGKQRNGPTGEVKLVFIEEWTKFENMAHESEVRI